LRAEIKGYQESYTRLERFTFGGVLVVYGFRLTNIEKIPKEVWWAVPLLVVIAGVRCLAYYFIINTRHAIYLTAIESEMYEGKFTGFQNFHSKKWPGREWNLLFNAAGWLVLLSAAVFAAYWRLALYSPVARSLFAD
jgi:hypothetical protein